MKIDLRNLRSFWAVFALVLFVGCAQVGARSFESYAADVIQTTSAVVTGTRTLLAAKKISSADAENVLKAAEVARDGVKVAREAAIKDPAAGMSRLRLAADAANQLSAYLASKGS